MKKLFYMFLLLLAPVAAATPGPRVSAVLPSGAQESAELLRFGNSDYLNATDVVRWLSATREWDGELEKLTLKFQGHVLRLTVDARWVQWDKTSYQGPDTPIYRGSSLWIPVSVFTRTLPVESGLRMRWDGTPRRLVAGIAPPAPAPGAAPSGPGLATALVEEQADRSILTLTFGGATGLERESTQRSNFSFRFRSARPSPGFVLPANKARLIKSLDVATSGNDAVVKMTLPPDAVGYVVEHLSGPERWKIAFSNSVDALESGKLTAFQMPGTRMPTRAARVVIDPGHGGADAGAAGGNLSEAVLVLDLARAVKAELEKDGQVTVFLTREADLEVPARRRAELANAQRAELVLSIHADGAPGPRVSGFQLVTWPAAEISPAGPSRGASRPGSLDLVGWEDAPVRHARASEALARDLETALLEVWQDGSRGISKRKLLPLEGLDMPAVMVECGTLSSSPDVQRLSTGSEVARLAVALAEGIRHHLAHTSHGENLQ